MEKREHFTNVAILTSGGDSPGMNSFIGHLIQIFETEKVNLFMIKDGFKGLTEGRIESWVNQKSVGDLIREPGTILKSSRFPAFHDKEVRKKAIENLKERNISTLITLGGEGTFQASKLICHEGEIQVICIPATIDNNVFYSDYALGFDTCLTTISEAVDKIYWTARSHDRFMIVECMGNQSGALTRYLAESFGAKVYSTPENYLSPAKLLNELHKHKEKKVMIIPITEKLYDSIVNLAAFLEKNLSREVRATSLGHIQRGGLPSFYDRFISRKLSRVAADLITKESSSKLFTLKVEKEDKVKGIVVTKE